MISMERRLQVGIATTVILILTRDILGLAIADIGLLGIVLGIMYTLSYKQLVYYLFFLFPLTCGIPGYIIFVGYLILLKKSKSVTQKQLLPMVIIALIDLFDEGFSGEPGTYTGIISFLSFCGVFFFFLNDTPYPKYNIPLAIRYFVIGTVFTFFIIFFNLLQQYNIYYILAGFARSGALGVQGNDTSIMKGHLAMNANTIAYYAVCAISSIIVLINSFQRKEAIGLILILILCGLLTISRTFILCLCLTAACYFFMHTYKIRMRILISVGWILLVGVFLYGDKLLLLSEGFIGRSNDADISTAGGRTLLFEEYNTVWFSSLKYILFGAGVVNYFSLLGCSNAMHSGLQQIWVCLGVTGFILFTQQILSFIYKYYSKRMLNYLLPFLVTLLFDQSIQFLNPYPLMLPIMVSLLVYKEGWLKTSD